MDASKTTLFNAFLILFVVVGSIIVYFIISLIRHQRRNQALHMSKILAEITTLEKERGRVAADLHDELGPILASVKFKVGSLEVAGEDDNEVVENINSNIDELINRMKDISNDLLPKTLLNRGLVAALTESVQMLNRGNELNIMLSHDAVGSMSQEKAVNIYRVLQEIIHNTIKHAGARNLHIDLRGTEKQLLIVSKDDGVGFDYQAKAREASGLGLRNMVSRTEILNGNMYIESEAGKGTKFTFEIPL